MSQDTTLLNGAKNRRITTNGFLVPFPSPLRKIIRSEGSHVIIVPGEGGKDHRFVFDNVFGPNTPEEQSYQHILPPLLDAVFSGRNASLLSIGGGGNTAWVLGKEHALTQTASPASPTKNAKTQKGVVTPPPQSTSLLRVAVINILNKLSIPVTGYFGLSFSAFEIYNDQIIDLLSKKKLEAKEHNLPNLTASPIRSLADFEDALTLVLLNGKIRNGELRSHIFFRFNLLSGNDTVDKSTPKSSPKVSRAKPDTKQQKSPTKTPEVPASPVFDIVMFAPYNAAAKEFLSSEQSAIKRSLLNWSHLVDKLNGDVTNPGISWRSFKLTQILHPTFTSPNHRIAATVHSYGHKTKLQESLWSFTLLESLNKLNDANPSLSSGAPSPKPTKSSSQLDHSPASQRRENGSLNGHASEHSVNGYEPTTQQWRPSGGPSPPKSRPSLPRHASESSFASSASASTTSLPPTNPKFKHLKLAKRGLSVSDLKSETSTKSVPNESQNGLSLQPTIPEHELLMPPETESSNLMREALRGSKVQNAQLLLNHAQLASQLAAKLNHEKEERATTEESLQKQLKKEREKRERLAKRLQNAEQLLESKEKEVVKLSDIVDKVAAESASKLAALEKVVKARNETYRQKVLEQESVIKRQNLAFKALQDRVSDLMERKALDIKNNKDGRFAYSVPTPPPPSRPGSAMPPPLPNKGVSMADKRDSLVLGSSDILGVVSGIDISRSEDEFELLQKLQKLIAEQTQDLSQVNQRVQEYEKDKVAVVAIETSVLDFENHITTLREQVTEELREYLDNVENAEIIAQLNDSIKQLGEGFKTQIVVNVPGAKKDNKYSELVGEIEGEMEASEVLRLVGHQLRSTLEDQAESFVAVLEDMHKLTDEELSEDLRLPIIWEPMRQDLEDIQDRLARDAAESDNSKSFTELASVYQWMQDQRQLFVHQRNLLDQICHKVIQVDGDEDEEDQPEGELEGELEGEEEGEYEEPNMTRESAEGEEEEEEEEEGVIVEDDEEDEELQDDEDEEDDDYSESYNPEEELDYGSSGED